MPRKMYLATVALESYPWRWKIGTVGADAQPIYCRCAWPGCTSNDLAGYVTFSPDGEGWENIAVKPTEPGSLIVAPQVFCAEHWPAEQASHEEVPADV